MESLKKIAELNCGLNSRGFIVSVFVDERFGKLLTWLEYSNQSWRTMYYVGAYDSEFECHLNALQFLHSKQFL